MKIGWYVALAIAALLIGGLAQAAPKVLNSTQLDRVAAGEAEATETDDTIVVDGGPGSSHTVVGAEAASEGIATYGFDNFTLQLDGNIAAGIAAAGDCNEVSVLNQRNSGFAVATGDNLELDVTFNSVFDEVTDGSAAVAGNHNDVAIDYYYADIEGQINGNAYGVVAAAATVDGSFNVEDVYTKVDADICKSFNVDTNHASISGQCGSSTIVLANAFGLQTLGVNLNVTSADVAGAATIPNTGDALAGCAETSIIQGVVNCGGFGFGPG